MSIAPPSRVPDISTSVSHPSRILHNSTLNLAGQVINAVCHLLVLSALARALSKDGLGEFFLIFSLTMAVQLVLEAGLNTVLTCRIAQAPQRWMQFIAEAAGLYVGVVVASVATLLIVGAVWTWFTGGSYSFAYFVAAACACAGMQVQRFTTGVFRAFEMFFQENLSRVIQGVIFAAGVIADTLLGRASIESALIWMAISHVVAGVYLLVALQWRWQCLSFCLSVSVARDWLRESVPLAAGDVIRELTLQLDTLLLGLMQPAAAVAVYSIAFRPLGPLNWVPRAVLTAIFPSFSRLAVNDPEQLKRVFADSIRLLWIVGILIAVAIFACAQPLVILLGGREYLEAVLPLRILIWITMLSFLSIQFRFVFAALGRQRVFTWLAFGVFVISTTIKLVLIPFWGYFGACAGSLVGEIVFTGAGLWIFHLMGVSAIEWGALLRAPVGGVVIGALLWTIRGIAWPGLLPLLVLCVALYFGLCVALKALRGKEVLHLYSTVTALMRPSNY